MITDSACVSQNLNFKLAWDHVSLNPGTMSLSTLGPCLSQPWDHVSLNPGTMSLSTLGPCLSQPWDHVSLNPGTMSLSTLGPCLSQPWDHVYLNPGTMSLNPGTMSLSFFYLLTYHLRPQWDMRPQQCFATRSRL